MIAASAPAQRPRDARLLVIGAARAVTQAARVEWVDHVRPGDLVVANDAATLPASLHGTHLASGAPLEVRLAGRASLAAEDVSFSAVLFGAGDWRTRTEERALPPQDVDLRERGVDERLLLRDVERRARAELVACAREAEGAALQLDRA